MNEQPVNSTEGDNSIKAKKLLDVKDHLGEVFSSGEILISKDMIDTFIQATGDVNPIHSDEEHLEKSILSEFGQGKALVPGFLTLSLIANKDVLYKSLQVEEPHEKISLGLRTVSFLSPVTVDTSLVFECTLRKSEDMEMKSRPGIRVEWDIITRKVVNDDKILCMRATWSIAYVSLSQAE